MRASDVRCGRVRARRSGSSARQRQGLCRARPFALTRCTGAAVSFRRHDRVHLARPARSTLLDRARARTARRRRRRRDARRLPARRRRPDLARGAGAGGARARAEATPSAARPTSRRTSSRSARSATLVARGRRRRRRPGARGRCCASIGADVALARDGRAADDDEDARRSRGRSRSCASTRRRTPTSRGADVERLLDAVHRRGRRRPTRSCSRTTTRACSSRA